MVRGGAPQRFPCMAYYRGATDQRHRYFIPIPTPGRLRETIELLQSVLLRTCEERCLPTVAALLAQPNQALQCAVRRCHQRPCMHRDGQRRGPVAR